MIRSPEDALAFFAPRTWDPHPDAPAASEHTLAWGQHTRMLRSDAAVKSLESWCIGPCVSYSFPRAHGEGLNLLSDMCAWGFFNDDMYAEATPEAVAVMLNTTRRCLHLPTDGEAPELPGADQALFDLLKRADATVNDAEWSRRFRSSISNYFMGALGTVLLGTQDEPVTLEQSLPIRANDVGMDMFADLVEHFEGFVLPPAVTALSSYHRLRQVVSEALAIQNDVFSYLRDSLSGDQDSAMNMVSAVRRTEGSTEAALEYIRTLYMDHTRELEHLTLQKFPDDCRRLGLTEKEMDNAKLYGVNIGDFIHGVVYSQIVAAKRGYMTGTVGILPASELRADYFPA